MSANLWAVHHMAFWMCVGSVGQFIDTNWEDPGILKFYANVDMEQVVASK